MKVIIVNENIKTLKPDDISKLLREGRTRCLLSIDDVLSRLKNVNISISQKTLYGYENNVATPKIRTFLALCDIYGVTDVMLALGISSVLPLSQHEPPLTPAGERIGRLYDKADDHAQRIVEVTLEPFDSEREKKPLISPQRERVI